MNDFTNFIAINSKIRCRGCLTNNDTVRSMSDSDIARYKIITCKINIIKNEDKMYICLNCRFMMGKLIRFITQCQEVNSVLNNEIYQDSNSFQSIPSLTITPPKVMYIGEGTEDVVMKNEESDEYGFAAVDDDEEVIKRNDSEGNLKKCEENCEESDEHDDVPLNMLRRHLDTDSKSNKVLNMDTKIHSKDKKILRESKNNKKSEKARNVKKELKDGFTSRMVQETNEYTVIKLTKEQVTEELRLHSQSDKYVRALYKCEKCVKGFNFEDVLRTHMEKHSRENGDFLCDICHQYCPTAVSLRGHLKSHTTRYKCKVCGDVRLSRQHLLEHHAISHTNQATEYSCDHCYFTTNKRTVIQRHVRTHKATEKHTCAHCGRTFRNVETLRVHITRHDKSKRLQCSECARKFIYPSLLQKHIQAVHVYKDYYCVECDVRFKSPDNLRLHFKKAKRHRDMSSYTHECAQCCQRFVSNSALSVHLTTSHGHPKRYVCEHCSRLYSSRESLKGHIRRVHDNKQPDIHTCEDCKKTFTRKSMLRAHMRAHSGEQPCSCHDPCQHEQIVK